MVPGAIGLTDRELQQIAREMNLSETVFALPPTDPAAAVKIRIFTPTHEIPFAGHPVVGTFFVLGKLNLIPLKEPVTRLLQECNIGVFPVELRVREGQIVRVGMSQPRPEFFGAVESVEDLYEVADALGLSKQVISGTKLPVEVVSSGLPVLIVPVRTAHGRAVDRSQCDGDQCGLRSLRREWDHGVYHCHGRGVRDRPYAHVRVADRNRGRPCDGQRERGLRRLSGPKRCGGSQTHDGDCR